MFWLQIGSQESQQTVYSLPFFNTGIEEWHDCHQHLTINDVSKFHQIVFLLAVQLLPTSYPYMHLSKKYFYQQTVKL